MPTLPDSGVSFTVQTNGQTLIVAAGPSASALTAPLYSDAAVSSSVTLPHTITSDTTYYLPLSWANVPLYISAKQPDGTELWGKTQLVGGVTIAPLPSAAQVGADLAFPRELSTSLAAGATTFPRYMGIQSGTAVTSGDLVLTYFTARKTETVSAIAMICGTTAAGATPSLVRYGLYLENPATLDVSLVASTVSDTALFVSSNTRYSKDLSSPYALVAGYRYAVGLLVVSATTMPSPMGPGAALGATTIVNTELNRAPRICSRVGSQADLPATLTDAALTTGAGRIAYYATLI